MDILKQLETEFSVGAPQVNNIVQLIDEGNTIPFIARYRKELTGSIDDQLLRELYERLVYLRNLDDRREQVRKTILGLEKLTDEISAALDKATTMVEIEDIYRPYKQKRRTKATIAKEKGLDPLADMLFAQETDLPLLQSAEAYISEELGVLTAEDALEGASHIVAETISDDPNIRAMIRKEIQEKGFVVAKATDEKIESVYEMYYDFQELVSKIAGHRILAVNRGEKEKFLLVKVDMPEEDILSNMDRVLIKQNPHTETTMTAIVEDSYKRLIAPSVEREVRNELTERAEDGAMKVFAENLQPLLLQAPIKDKVVVALDPGFRTGCKVAVVDGTGKVLDTGVIYPTTSQFKADEAKVTLMALIQKHNVDIVAIGNGTASRETESFAVDALKELEKTNDKKIYYIIVNEAGASVYSASKLAAEEFPDYDVALRSAVSIGRRIQDPLAELVKIDPQSIGVGQYQHDLNQKRLGETLGGVVEDCVNSVGVDLNTASPSLLSYVSGISMAVAKNILDFREENGKFTSRVQLKKVKKLGPKAYEQCAGFLRIVDGKHILDNTGVHPESYKAAETLLHSLKYSLKDVSNKNIKNLQDKVVDTKQLAEEIGIGVPTLIDMMKELEKPGRDPREDMPPPVLRSDVLSMEDLTEGMILQGTVRNVIDFGAFVDIGVHQDGLVHISQLANKFVKHPLDAVSIGDIVDVKVLSVDIKKKRIALSMKNLK